MRLYTLHHKGSGDIRVIADRFDWFALALAPLWAVWHGLWITLAGQILLLALAVSWSPAAAAPMLAGLAAIAGTEGGSLRRAELRLRRWREAGVVEARSPEGAEELYLRGEAA